MRTAGTATPGVSGVAEVDLDEPITDLDAALGFVTRICFKLGPPRLTGLELEWLLADAVQPDTPLDPRRLASALGPWCPPDLPAPPARPAVADRHRSPQGLPGGSTVTIEPGGQVEISTPPFASLDELVQAACADAAQLHAALAAERIAPLPGATDALRVPSRIRDTPRYAAMESHFDRRDPAGRTMMSATAAVQVAVDAGDTDFAQRWHAAHALGPVLIATFANSPWLAGSDTGWKSARQRAWQRIGSAAAAPVDPDPRISYAHHALAAELVCVRRPGTDWHAPGGVTMADWIHGALDAGPTYDDLRYHLTTLFPPVRPQGHYEIRYIDAQRGEDWIVPAALVWALFADPLARDAAVAAAEPVAESWVASARDGLEDPELAAAAGEVMTIGIDALAGVSAPIQDRVRTFAHRYTFAGRCPADDWTEGNRT